MTELIPEVLFADRKHPHVIKNLLFNMPGAVSKLTTDEGVTIDCCTDEEMLALKSLSTTKKRIILGIDPSINCTGICLSDGDTFLSGCILPGNRVGSQGKVLKTPKFVMGFNKTRFLVANLLELLRPIASKLELVVIEGVANSSMGASRSILDLAALKGRYEAVVMAVNPNTKIMVVSPNKLKSVATGNFRAGKEEMIEAAKLLFNLDFINDDERKVDDEVDAFFLMKIGEAMRSGRSFTKLEWN